MKKRVSVLLGLACLLSLNMKNVYADEHSVNRIHFINTKGNSGSDAILLESNGHFALIDTGEDFDFPDGTNPLYPIRKGNTTQNYKVLEDRVLRHLKNVGVNKLDFVLGTHVHSDHIGGVDEVLNHYSVEKLYLKRYSDNRLTDSTRLWDNLFNYDNALKAAKNKNVKIIQDISEKDSHFKLGDMDIQLYNYKNEYDNNGNLKRVYDDNSNSIVAVITVNGQKIYLGGDLDNAEGAEDQLGPQIGKVDLMKWNHHSESTKSNSINFLENLKPSLVVQTTGQDINVPSTKKWLEDRGTKIVKATSKQYDATVYDINQAGFTDVSNQFPQIPTVETKWYVKDGFRMYQLDSGEKAIGWHTIDNESYFFDGKGHLQTEKWQLSDDYWYYLHKDGKMAKAGWLQLGDDWYYLNPSGSRENDKLSQINGKTYLFDENGKMQTGWKWHNGAYHFYEENGSQKTGWYEESGKWYYLTPENGEMAVGTAKVYGLTYYFNNAGEMQTGWKWHDDGYHYYQESGSQKTGWLQESGKWYYLTPKDGSMAVGTHEIKGDKYYFNTAGEMQTGWKWHDDAYHYYQENGAQKLGWFQESGKWYYLQAPEGRMVTGLHEVANEYYYFNTAGEMQTGWKWIEGYYHYFQESGKMIRDGETPDGYKVDHKGRWLQGGETTTTVETTVVETTKETTVVPTTEVPSTQEPITVEPTTVEETTTEPTSQETTTKERKTIPIIRDDKPIRRVQDIF
ncbi:MBL fold metallo-hydrolase [Granulicatella adiacens]|uniref:MBL fold metallo-hydrolase n=1 Tax=Granulicatella adiacens TaxID=46124 RepID=UPI004028CA2B